MGIAVSLLITAVGLVLALAVHPSHPGSVDVNTVGWILFLVGLIGFILDLLLWSQWGPGYLRRRTTYVNRGVAAQPVAAQPVVAQPVVAQPVATQRRVVEEVVDDGPGY